MKIGELLPSVEDWKRLQDIESALLRRRTVGRLAGLIALVSAALQVVFTIADKGYFDKLRTIFWSLITLRFEDLASIGLDFKTLITWILLLFAAFVYFLLRRTSVLLKESKEPFRYTFWIEPFEEIKGTPGERFRLGSSDRFALFDHDLIERLNRCALLQLKVTDMLALSRLRSLGARMVLLGAPRPASPSLTASVHCWMG